MKTIASNSELVWAKSTAGLYHPLTGPYRAHEVQAVRSTVELNRKTGNIQVQVYYEYSYDLVTWTRPSTGGSDPLLGSAISTDTVSYGTTFQALTAVDAQRWVRFGAFANLTSGTTLAVGYVTIELDIRNA